MKNFQFVEMRTQNQFAKMMIKVFKTLPKKRYAKRSKASMCRELLRQINSLTFLVLEEEILDKLEEDLRRSETASST